MFNWIKKYWLEVLVFGAIFAILLIDLAPDYTFINKAADSIGYAYSAQYIYPSYHTSPPLYLLISNLFMRIPYGTDAWQMGLLSVLSTMVVCVFIYLIARKLIKNRYLPILAVAIYGFSALVICQSVIIQTYPLVCALASGAYYFALCKKWKLMALMIGIGLAVHVLMGFIFLVMFCSYKEYRKNWKCLLISLSFMVFYLYIPLTNREPYMWFPDPNQTNTILAVISDTFSTIISLIGQLSMWDIPKRILDTIGILGVGIGVVAVIPVAYYFWKTKLRHNTLFWLAAVPTLLFISELDMNTFDYTMLSMPFLSIAVVLGIDMLLQRYNIKGKLIYVLVVISVLGFGIFNANYFDVGRTLDKNMSASNLYYNEFVKLPDNAIFMPNYAWEWEAIYKYNKDYDKHIYPICKDILPSELYCEQLEKDGINLVLSDDTNNSIKATEIAESIVELNDNVWTTISTNPSTFGSIVVETNHDTSLVNIIDEVRMKEVSENPKVSWKPYNPYSIYTTSIFVTQWTYVLSSNKNITFVAFCALLGYTVFWALTGGFKKKKRVIQNEITKDKSQEEAKK